MFFLLNRILRGIFIGIWVLILVYVYQQRAVFYPALDFVQALKIRQDYKLNIVGEVTGEVTKVQEDFIFQMKSTNGLNFSLRLAGLELQTPDILKPKEAAEMKEATQEQLEKLISSKKVRVALTVLSEQRTGAGLVYAGPTNVNASLVRAGRAQLKREYLRGVPLRELYALVQAERLAKEDKAGIWAESE